MAACGLCLLGTSAAAAPAAGRVRLSADTPAATSAARPLGRLPASETVAGAVTLALRNQEQLSDLLTRLHDPADPLYGKYLTPEEFTARFGPTERDYAAAADYARASGLTVTGTHPNRLLLDVSGSARAQETAFGVQLARYQDADGRVFRAPSTAPSVPRALAGIITGVAGLSSAVVRRPHAVRLPESVVPLAGTGPGGGLSPANIKAAYGLGGTALTGSGQTLALFELDGYDPADIAAYESRFGLPSVPLQNVLLNTATGAAGINTDEVTLDIEMQLALAPGAGKIIVYETGNSDAEVLDCYSRIANDNLAKQISTSWGAAESQNTANTLQTEHAIFQQMAAQGQTIYAAAGDNGAYDTGSALDGLSVDDPAAQPSVCGVGGTTLTTSAAGAYLSEKVWNAGSAASGGGGGGISSLWPIPSWQSGAISAASRGSRAMRNVPDVALNSDPNTGYAVYVQGAWAVYGGTSAASPLWAGFTALVNQGRAANGLPPLGQASPALYPLLTSPRYSADFHDIASGTNLYYPAVAGYDDASGLGTPIGAGLLADLVGTAPVAAASALPTHLLWDNADGRASVWNLADTNPAATCRVFGPYPGWTALALTQGPDGNARLLWNNSDGRVSVWNLADTNPAATCKLYGPYGGWTGKALTVGPDNSVHLLWDNTDGRVSVWNLSDPSAAANALIYGPYSGWSGTALGVGPNNQVRLLWNSTGGQASVWNLADTNPAASCKIYGPYSGWTVNSLTVGPDNAAHLLWDNADGRVSLWNLAAASPDAAALVYGPYSGWSGTAIAEASDNHVRLLWNKSGGQVSVWNFGDMNPAATCQLYGPYSGWTAVGISGG